MKAAWRGATAVYEVLAGYAVLFVERKLRQIEEHFAKTEWKW